MSVRTETNSGFDHAKVNDVVNCCISTKFVSDFFSRVTTRSCGSSALLMRYSLTA
jgi:hypothetical protein